VQETPTRAIYLRVVIVIIVVTFAVSGIYTLNEINKEPKSKVSVFAEVKEKEWRECHLYLVRLKIDVDVAEGEKVVIAKITTLIINRNVSWTESPNITITASKSEEFTAILHPKLGLVHAEYCETFEIGVEVETIIHYQQFGTLKAKSVTVRLEFPIEVTICGSG